MRRSLKTRIAVALGVLLIGALAASWAIFRMTLKEHLIRQASFQLSQQTQLTAQLLEAKGLESFSALLDDQARMLGGRITLIDSTGRPLLDSSIPTSSLDNHASRPEVAAARRDGEGFELRYSRSEGNYYLYCARTVLLGKEPAVLRLSLPLQGLTEGIGAANRRFLILLAVVAAVALAFMLWTLRRLFRPLQDLAAVADQVTADRLPLFPIVDDPDLRRLSQAMSAMSARLTAANLEVSSRRAELESLIETLPVGVIVVRGSAVVRCNSQACRMLDAEDLFGKSASSALPPELLGLIDRLDGGEIAPSAELVVPERNTCFACQGRLTPRGYLIVIVDQSDAWRLDAARRTFIADAGHEFQTPLTAIGMTAEFLMEDASDAQKRHLERILEQQKRLTGLIDNLLYLSRLEAEPEGLPMEQVDLAELCRGTTDDYKALPAADGVEISCSVPDDAPILGSPDELKTALGNLLDNALKFTRAKFGKTPGAKIAVSVERDGDEWRVQVSDNGVGLSDDDTEALFHRFSRGDRSRGRGAQVGGYGLGLAIVKRIILRHGGHVAALPSSEGACMAFWLPVGHE